MPTLTLHSSNTHSRIQLAHVAQCTETEGAWKKTFSQNEERRQGRVHGKFYDAGYSHFTSTIWQVNNLW
jgi:hypothetical protein